MKIHTNKLTRNDLYAALPDGLHLECVAKGSRKRDHAFDVGIGAMPGTDAHGIKRCYARNSGTYGAAHEYGKAATYIEWGDWMVELFKIDPDAIVGPYEGIDGFIDATTHQASWRPEREAAHTHADRWARELNGNLSRGIAWIPPVTKEQ